MFWPFILHQTMNIDFLSPRQWHIMLTGTTWILVHPWDMLFALPQTTRLLNSWKNSFSMNTSQHSEHFFWITPWTETFWAHCSGISCRLSLPWHVSTYIGCSTMDHKDLWHTENHWTVLPWTSFSILAIYFRSKHVIHTFWAHYNADRKTAGHLSTD